MIGWLLVGLLGAASAALEGGADPAPPQNPWVAIPGGTFQMGAEGWRPEERPVHEAQVAGFELLRTEVTNTQFRLFQADYMTEPKSACDDCPAVRITWEEAAAYCRSVGGRLPTEAEWEYAARGGLVRRMYPWGDENPHDRACWGRKDQGACRVGNYPPNPFGLLDMAGNVWEWTADGFDAGAYSRPPGSPPLSPPPAGLTRVIRGGAYLYEKPESLRCARRGRVDPRERSAALGVRCARDLTPATAG